ncbi:MAG: hypothetical protein FWH56_02520 [Betaproteobacteria bacterium]|nr:hypothetical protein [Betaproteobacteria bacterium]
MSTNFSEQSKTPDDSSYGPPVGDQNMLKAILKGIGTVAVLGGFVYWLLIPTSTPGCNAKETQNALFRLSIPSTKDITRNMMNPRGSTSFSFRNPTELNYDAETGIRSCMANVFASSRGIGEDYVPSTDTGEKIGFTIERDPDKSGDFIVRTVPIEFLKARIASKDTTDKKFGTPVGRDAMQKAVMAGLRKIDKDTSARMPGLRHQRSRDDTPLTYADNVKNVLPTADCRELDEGRYGCPVQIEFRDFLLGAIGASPWLLLKGEFVFVREGNEWKVADDFSNTFMQAIVKSRFGIDDAEDG